MGDLQRRRKRRQAARTPKRLRRHGATKGRGNASSRLNRNDGRPATSPKAAASRTHSKAAPPPWGDKGPRKRKLAAEPKRWATCNVAESGGKPHALQSGSAAMGRQRAEETQARGRTETMGDLQRRRKRRQAARTPKRLRRHGTTKG